MTTDHSRHVVYLHGFPSSPASNKAQRFRLECEARGISFRCPDLNPPELEAPTVKRMLDQARQAIEATGDGPVMLVGSSFGGFVAVHAAAQDQTARIVRLALMAPAFDIGGNEVCADGAQYDAFRLALEQPIQIFHGRKDDTVLPSTVEAWAKGRPNVELHWYDDGHQLAESVEDIVGISISRFAT